MYHRHEPSSFEITSNGARSLSNKTPTPGSNFVAEVDPSTCSINAVQFDTTENIETRLREVISKKDEGAADRFWWINGCRCPANAIAHFGSLCGLHHLTLEDIASESNEKSEIFSSQRYMYSVIHSEDLDGVEVPIHVILSKRWILTLHDSDCSAVHDALHRLTEECNVAARRTSSKAPASALSQQAPGPTCPNTPAWVLYSLLDVDTDIMIPCCERLVSQALELDQLVFLVTIRDEEDVLRRISWALSGIHTMKERVFARQRLLATLLSASATPFITPALKFYIRDACDHAVMCENRLSFADQVLSMANSNFLACISIEAAYIANNTNSIMRKLTAMGVIFSPYMMIVSFFGMNCLVPFKYDDSTAPFWGIVIFCGVMSFVLYISYHIYDERKKKQHFW